MATANKFNVFGENLAEKVHDLSADSLKVMLTLTAPVAANSVKGDLTEIAAGNGYTAGGEVSAQTGSAQTGGTYKLTLTDVVWTSTGAFADFRYPVLYNDTPASPLDPLGLWWDYGSTVTLANGETFTWDQDIGGNGILTLA